MTVTEINNDTASLYSANPTLGGELGKNDFLRLLVTQLQNQDPINPMNSSEFASQLAQFNSVEQMININEGIQALAEQQQISSAGLNNSLATGLVGKEVKAVSNELVLSDGNPASMNYTLFGSASDVEVVVRDQEGNTVRTVDLGSKNSGEHAWEWDGKNNSGSNMPDGTYSIEIVAKDGNAGVNAITYITGNISKVKFTSEGVRLYVDGRYINLGDVEEIGEAPQ